MQQPAGEQSYVGRRARRAGTSQMPASESAPWRSAIVDAGAQRLTGAIDPVAAESVATERVVEAEPIAPAAAADLKTERLVLDETAAAERDQARVEQARAEQAAAERVAAEQARAAHAAAERLAAEQAHAERIAAEQEAAAKARAEEEARRAQIRAERAERARAEQATAQQRRAAQASASQPSESAFATDPSVDAFSAAAEAFGFSAEDLDDTVEPAAEASAADETKKQADQADTAHVAPRRRRRLGRKIVAAGASLGVMAVAGLMLVSTTLPSEAVAAAQGQGAQSLTSLAAPAEDTTQRKAVEKDIQAFVAPSDVASEEIARSGEYSSMSMADLAAEEGIHYSTSVYTNDTTALIQWPFAVGTGMSWPYGMRRGRMHQGIDLIPGNGAPIQAIADGVVRKATENGGGYGVTVYIDHMIDGKVVTSHYSHMQHGSIRVKTGQQVKVGDIVGLVGNTGHSYGAHLHFELLRNGQTFDPLPWMKANAGRHDGVGPIS
ncbi:M23 family metallopeptidase [Microbacterium sp. NPDC057659]|uniref:M23 family metallopeptidase n=1 Tax=Microbacterium sp. NPDC057659 TaxID=3346198 RepID=UPI00366EF5D4